MLDPKYVYENIDYIRKVCTDKFVECDLDEFVRLYEAMKDNQKQLDALNTQKKQAACGGNIGKVRQCVLCGHGEWFNVLRDTDAWKVGQR